MKKVVWVFFFVVSSSRMFAQIDFGLKAGINGSKVVFNEIGEPRSKIGLNAGGFTSLRLNKNFLIQGELLYLLKGYSFPKNLSYSGKLNLNYLSLPVMAVVQPSKNLRFLIGPQISFLLSQVWKTSVFAKSFANTDFSGIVGASYNILKELGIEVRYDHGLINVYNRGSNDIPNGYNRSIQLWLIYQFKH